MHARLCVWMRGIEVCTVVCDNVNVQTQISMGVATSIRPPGELFSLGIRS